MLVLFLISSHLNARLVNLHKYIIQINISLILAFQILIKQLFLIRCMDSLTLKTGK